MLTRRAALTMAAATAMTSLSGSLRAQSFPTRSVTIVVPYPAGGPVDAVARLIANEAMADLGQAIVVDNRAGGSGVIGSVAVARAAPDGHTIVLGTNQTHATNESLLKSSPYQAVKDFVPVAGVADIPHLLVARKDLPVANAAELIALAKQKPGALNYGSTGNGSASHLAGELFKVKAGVNAQHVPFRGAAPMVQELLGGRVDYAFATLPSVLSQVEAGELKAIAVASARRPERLPNVPTLNEAGLPGVEADAWFALFAPAQTPPSVLERLYQSIAAALEKEGSKAALARQGMILALRKPADVAAWLPAEVEKWAAVIKAANVTVE